MIEMWKCTRVAKGKYKMNLEYAIMPESNDTLKERWERQKQTNKTHTQKPTRRPTSGHIGDTLNIETMIK